MIALPGGEFRMGSDRHYREEAPVRFAKVGPFEVDRAPVTNADFATFVHATGYVTLAERRPDPADHPGVDPVLLVPGSAVFAPPAVGARGWWSFRPGAYWRVPQDDGRPAEPSHPVVHVAAQDAEAYAAWAGKSLPTEAEWEYAARGGLDGTEYAWGDHFVPNGVPRANTWQGRFPFRRDGPYARTSPVGVFPANGFDLVDTIGNVWEWTATPWQGAPPTRPCCTPASAEPERRVIKGGSHLCAPSYSRRYRPAARQPQSIDGATSHLGFRCVRRPGG